MVQERLEFKLARCGQESPYRDHIGNYRQHVCADDEFTYVAESYDDY